MLQAIRMAGIKALALMLTACVSAVLEVDGKATQPIPATLLAEISRKSMSPSAPILIRIFKQESELEIWKRDRSGQFVLLKTYPMCRWLRISLIQDSRFAKSRTLVPESRGQLDGLEIEEPCFVSV